MSEIIDGMRIHDRIQTFGLAPVEDCLEYLVACAALFHLLKADILKPLVFFEERLQPCRCITLSRKQNITVMLHVGGESHIADAHIAVENVATPNYIVIAIFCLCFRGTLYAERREKPVLHIHILDSFGGPPAYIIGSGYIGSDNCVAVHLLYQVMGYAAEVPVETHLPWGAGFVPSDNDLLG